MIFLMLQIYAVYVFNLCPIGSRCSMHGAEHLFPDGRRELEQASPEIQAKLDELRALLKRDSLGGLFEDKENGAVMH